MFKKKKSTKDLVHPEGTEERLDEAPPEKEKKRKDKPSKERKKVSLGDIVKSRAFVGALCILAGLVIAFGVTPYIQSRIAQTTQVVLLKENQPAGSQITGEMLETKEMSLFNLPEDRIENPEDAEEHYLRVAAAAGDILTKGRISETVPGEDPELAKLPKGEMAMSVTLSSLAQNLSGKLRAGDVIRLYATAKQSTTVAGTADTTISVPEFQYVEVLAATNQAAKNVSDQGKEDVTDSERQIASVTLAVNEKQARVLAELEQSSVVHAALVVRGDENAKKKALDAQRAYFDETEKDQIAKDTEPVVQTPTPDTPTAQATEGGKAQ